MTAIHDLTGIETEHLLGDTSGPLVKIRAQGTGVVLVGQVAPEAAREIAAHLTEAAARAEYEADLWTAMQAEGFDERTSAAVLLLVRRGETARHTDNQGGPDGDHA